MDRDNFNAIIARYLEKFDYSNTKGEEYFKWNAIDCFQKNWNLDSADLLGSFTAAMKSTSVLISGSFSNPPSGIIALLGIDGEVEFVREAFRELLDPQKDINQRDSAVFKFVSDVNERIEKHWPNDKYKRQSTRAALCYLTLADPKHNFFYMYKKADNWAVFTEYGWDLGSGDEFSLPVYYQMCEELVEEIRKNPDLRRCDQLRQESAGVSIYDDFHTLAYDIIYCATTYHNYIDLPIYYPKGVKNRILRAKSIAEIEEKQKKLTEAERSLEEFKSTGCLPPELTGHSVIHKSFGEGLVVEQKPAIIKVQFPDGIKSLEYPKVFVSGFLKASDEDMNRILASASMKTKREQLEKELKYAKEDYEKAVSEFNAKWTKIVDNSVAQDDGD